jgi:hypothetical protein
MQVWVYLLLRPWNQWIPDPVMFASLTLISSTMVISLTLYGLLPVCFQLGMTRESHANDTDAFA